MDTENQKFAQRLKEALRQAQVDPGKPSRITAEFNKRYNGQPVTVYGVRKWLNGESIPAQPKLMALARWLLVNPLWLRYGEIDAQDALQSNQQFVDLFEMLDADDRQMVLKIMRGLLAQRDAN